MRLIVHPQPSRQLAPQPGSAVYMANHDIIVYWQAVENLFSLLHIHLQPPSSHRGNYCYYYTQKRSSIRMKFNLKSPLFPQVCGMLLLMRVGITYYYRHTAPLSPHHHHHPQQPPSTRSPTEEEEVEVTGISRQGKIQYLVYTATGRFPTTLCLVDIGRSVGDGTGFCWTCNAAQRIRSITVNVLILQKRKKRELDSH